MATKTPSATSDVVVSWQTAETPFGPVRRGERYRTTDDRVTHYKEFFVPADTPREEWPHPYDHVANTNAEREREEQLERDRVFAELASHNVVTLRAPEIVKSVSDFVGWYDGKAALIRKGSTATASDPVVTQSPENWKPA